MCILCVIQKWSRRIATVLPLLVLPLIGLWALSQMLPPAFRFEITSPRLACVFVLLVTLFWYEILMPKLSAWRAHRNARLRERKRNQAIELQKLRKTATRKCRNCLTPYRDQNPCGGKFMCSYCGHISKRPVLDLPVPPGMAMSNSGIIKELVGKGGKLLNGRPWSENGWMCSQEWRDNGNWGGGGTFAPKPVNWRKNANGFFGGDEYCSTEKSYSGVVIFTCKLLTSFLLSIRWLWRKIFSGRSSSEVASFGTDSGLLSKRGESIGNFNESRSERARRKAEEKRQARIEKELLEEEERKQREEVARLVEERRKLRDVKSAAEKDTEKAISPVKDKGSKREAEKKRQERRKERDRGSSKSSNSDAEELEKKVGKEAEKKRDSDKRSESDGREHRKFATDIVKGHSYDIGRGQKNVSPYNVNRGSAGARYLDRMRNNLLSSSKAFSGSNFFGRTANSSAVIQKESKLNSSVNHVYSSAQKKEVGPPERVAGQSVLNGIPSEPQPQPAPKKSWQQLFTRATPVHPSSSANVISRPNVMVPTDVKSPPLPSQTGPAPFNDKQINFGFQSPFPVYTSQNATASSSLGFSPAIDPIFPHVGGRQHEHIPEESDLFEDPCYVPDPALLLGPVSESLDNFQLDLGSGFISDIGLQKPRASKIAGPASEISRPSPIESPMSRLRGIDDRHSSASGLPGTPKLQDKRNSPFEDEKSWQLWGPSPLGQDGLGLIGGSPWHLAPEPNRLSKEEFVRPSPQRTMVSLFSEDHGLPSTCSPQKDLLHGGQNSGLFSPLAVSNDKDPWMQQAFIPPLSDTEKHFPFKHQEEPTENDAFFGSPTGSAPNHPFMLSPADRWSKKEWAAAAGAESGEDSSRNQAVASPPQSQNGDVYPPPPPPLLMYSHFGGK